LNATSSPRRLALWAALALATVGAWRLVTSPGSGASGPDAAAADPSLLFDRVWLDAQPDKPTDYVQAFYASQSAETSVFQKASSFDFHFELATFRSSGTKLSLFFPQTGKTAEVSFSVRACSDMPPFDLCLELSNNPWGGPRRYHGMKEQEDESATVRKASKALRAVAGE